MKRAVILHGTDSTPNDNWFPWLGEQLERHGWKVWTPQLPGADYPSIKTYNDYLFAQNWDWQDCAIIGHSSGAVAALGVLQQLPEGITCSHAYLVSAFKDNLGWKDNTGRLKLEGLFETDFEWPTIRNHCKHITLIHSTDDPYCPMEHASYLAVKLKGELILQHGQKHFNLEANPAYTEFQLLLDRILADTP